MLAGEELEVLSKSRETAKHFIEVLHRILTREFCAPIIGRILRPSHTTIADGVNLDGPSMSILDQFDL